MCTNETVLGVLKKKKNICQNQMEQIECFVRFCFFALLFFSFNFISLILSFVFVFLL